MQENEFEKQFKHIMEDFHLPPPASVWDEVSRKLNKKPRRKLPFIFLLVIVLAGAGYFMFKSESNVQDSKSIADNTVKKTTSPDSIISKDKITTIEKNIGEANHEPHLSLKNINDINTVENKSKIFPGITIPLNQISQTNNITKVKVDIADTNFHQSEIPVSNKIDSSIFLNDLSKNPVTEDTATIVKNNVDSITADTNSVVVERNKTDSVVNNSNKKPTHKTYKLPNWQWGITAFYGRSNAVENLANLNKSAASSLYNPDNTPWRDTSFHNSHVYTSSNAYQLGAVLQKKILKNGFIAAGLNFTHLSTKSDVNKKIDSTYIVQNSGDLTSYFSVNEYFQPGPLTSYTNTYNFIELPVYFQQDFFYAKKFSFSYNAGFSIRQLISSKALLYDDYNNIYFQKDELLNKTQFQFLAGFSLKINTGKSSSVYIGPQFSYSLSDLIKNNNSKNFHFISYGLQAGIMLHKN